MKTLYLDCFSGIAGDMAVAALVDAGADPQIIEEELSKLPLDPYTLKWSRVVKKGIASLKLDVELDPDHPPKKHRHYTTIVKMIEESGLSNSIKRMALNIFQRIGEAEAKIHNIPLEKVHFHEVGAVDSIVDVIGVAIAIDNLGIEQIISSSVPVGSGKVKCDHGIYPVPAPATLELLKGLPIATSIYTMELTTPTGAGIIAALAEQFSPSIPAIRVDQIGYGAGTRDLPDQPNVLRVIIGESSS